MARVVRRYKPKTPFTTPMKLLIPTTKMVKGVAKKVFSDPEDSWQFFGSFRTFGGTENFFDNVYVVYNTATIDTWYDPRITSDCQIYICETGERFEIISPPEDIDTRHQYLQFRVQKVGGKP